MERRSLGDTGAHVGVIGLGTATWGRGTDRETAREQLQLLVSSGGNLIDIGEEALGSPLAADVLGDPGLRREAFLSLRLSARGSQRDMLAQLDEALRSLGIGHVDLWTVEGWEERLPWRELVSALSVASMTGRAHYVGICPTEPWQATLIGAGLGMHPDRPSLAAITTPYSLLDVPPAARMTDAAAALGTSLIAAWPLAGGVLTGKYRHATPPDSRGAGERHAVRLHRYRGAWSRPVVDGLCAAAEGLGTTPGALALAWVRDRATVAACLVGTRTVHQWKSALASSDVALPPEIREALDEVADEAAALGHDGEVGAGTP